MKIGIFEPVCYYDPQVPRGFPLAPKHFDAALGVRCMQDALHVAELADDLGFDHVGVAEHHFAARQLTPDPTLFAAAMTQRVRNAQISVLGVLLPMLDPIRVAEQFAMLDTLSNGRLLPGVFRGTPNELLVYHTNPLESRARYEEAVRLLQRCWSEPEPFGWEGVYYRYRSIAVWPRPVQQPLPLLVSANSETSAQFAGTHHLQMGFSLGDLTRKAAHVAIYKNAAREAGWTAAPENLLTRYIIYVGESDQKAREDFTRLLTVDGPPDARRMAYLQALMAAGVGRPIPLNAPPPPPKPQGDPGSKGGPAAGGFPTLVGSPDTLLRKMQEIVEATGVGRFDLIFTGVPLPYEMGVASLKLFAREMLPTLKALNPQPAFDKL